MIDTHIHSLFSTDSVMDAEEACKKAISLGLGGIAFTDHLDYDYPGEDFLIDFDKYSEFMDNLKKKYNGTLKILKGVEVGIQPHVIDKSLEVTRKYGFDYVIGSIHIIDGMDPYTGGFYEGRSKEEAYGRYLKEILFMIDNFRDFDIAGHFEYITRYPDYEDRSLRYTDYSDIFDEIFRKLIYEGKGFEINTASFRDRKGTRTTEFDTMLLKRYKELGGEIVSLGSDAHSTEFLGYKFDIFSEILKEFGFRYVVYFEKRKPVFERIG